MHESEVVRRASALPERFADRLSEDDFDTVSGARDGGEWAEEVENLVAALADNGAAVTARERDELAELCAAMGLPTDRLAGLNVAS